jgi:Tol biopolymer transport system component
MRAMIGVMPQDFLPDGRNSGESPESGKRCLGKAVPFVAATALLRFIPFMGPIRMDRRQFLQTALNTSLLNATALRAGAIGTAAAWSIGPVPSAAAAPPLPVFPPPTILTANTGFSDERPCFSPSGKTVLFMRSAVTNSGISDTSAFYSIPITGSPGQETLFNTDPLPSGSGSGGFTRPDWSWTRRSWEIAFSTNISILLLDVRTRKVQLLPALTGDIPNHKRFEYPSWYNNGYALVATNYWGSPGDPDSRQHLLRYDLNSKQIRTLTSGIFPLPANSPNNIWPGMSSVSQQGSPKFGGRPLIAFAGERPNASGYNQDNNQIWILDPPTRGPTQPGNVHVIDPQLPLNQQQGRAPWWSPNGRFLAFESNRITQNGNYQIFIQSPFRPELIVPATPQSWAVQHAKWSPCGTKIVFGYRIIGHAYASGIASVQLPPQLWAAWALNWSLSSH